MFPRVVEITDSEARAKEIFDTLPKVELTGPAVDPVTFEKILGVYKSLSGVPNGKGMFLQAVTPMLPEGLSAEDAWNMAMKQAGMPF